MSAMKRFQASYSDSGQFPRNHWSSASYGTAAIARHRARLWIFREDLFVADHPSHRLPVRDISASGRVTKRNIYNDDELEDFFRQAPSNGLAGADAPEAQTEFKEDEKCRFVFLCAESTVGPLFMSAKLLLRLLSFYQVTPHYLDFLYVYASRHGDDEELHFSGFRTEKTLVNPPTETVLPELGRTGRGYQLCYNLKTAADKGEHGWKIRQAAIYHHFDVGQGTQLWMIGDPHEAIKERIGDLYALEAVYPTSFSTLEQSFKSSMRIHSTIAIWATSEWRWNVRFLEKRAEDLTIKVALVKEKAHIESLDPGSLGAVQRWEEKNNDTVMAMESNVNILTLLQKYYRDIVMDENFPPKERRACQQAVKDFSFQLEELVCETRMQIARAKVLMKVLADRKTILIQHLQAQSAIISSRLAASMYEQADQSAMEAIAVRIVTIVTLVYLPATFSSTFFSTDVVKYQGGEIFSALALERFLQVTLPLMVFTFVPAGMWFWVEWRKRRQKSDRTRTALIDVFQPETEDKAHKYGKSIF